MTDVGYQLRDTEVVSVGGLDFTHAPEREVLSCVLRRDGWAVAIAHNQPRGAPAPSRADTEVTEGMRAAARLVGVRLIAHVVVGEGGWAEVPPSSRLAELFAAAVVAVLVGFGGVLGVQIGHWIVAP